MLLIAQPKSASTSLMWSISEILKITHKNGQSFTKNDKKCEGYEELQKYHGTTIERSFEYMEKYIVDKKVIYKEHILPIEKHLEIIEKINKPVVVLLRKPKETIESYKRVFSVLPELNNIDYDKLYEEVKLFYNTYEKIDSKLYLIVKFRDVVFDFYKTMEKIIKHYGFKIPNNLYDFELEKRNYTGHGLRKIMEKKSASNK
jgi:hypothetical protein